MVRRDNGEKEEVSLAGLEARIGEILEQMQKDMYDRAKARRDSQTYEASDYEEFKNIFAEKTGFVKALWCGDRACEDKIKEELAVTSRCMPLENADVTEGSCVCCGRPAKKMVYWGKAY